MLESSNTELEDINIGIAEKLTELTSDPLVRFQPIFKKKNMKSGEEVDILNRDNFDDPATIRVLM